LTSQCSPHVTANDGAAGAANRSAIRRIVDHSPDLPAVNSTDTSAPMMPQRVHTIRGPNAGTGAAEAVDVRDGSPPKKEPQDHDND